MVCLDILILQELSNYFQRANPEKSISLIEQLFHEIGKLHPSKVDKDSQTDTTPETLGIFPLTSISIALILKYAT